MGGYTLMASSCSLPGEVLLGSKWSVRLTSSKPLHSFTLENCATVSDFGGVYKPNFGLVLYRHIIGCAAHSLVAIETQVTDVTAGLIMRLYRLKDLEESEDPHLVQPVFSAVGLHSIIIPSLDVSKDVRWLLDVQIDPLTTGDVLAKQLAHKRAQISGQEVEEVEELKYTMKVVSGAAVQMASDKTQEEDFTAIKTGWVKSAAGRDKKSKASRQHFLDSKVTTTKKQAIVTEFTQHQTLVTREALTAEKRARALLELKGERHIVAMTAKRDALAEEATAAIENREAQTASWRTEVNETLAKMNAERAEYREEMLKDDAVITQLKDALDIPGVMWYESPAEYKASKGAKGGGKGATTFHTLQSYVPSLLEAMDRIAEIEPWKTASLVARAEAKLTSMVVQSLQTALTIADADPPPVEEAAGKKKGKEERQDPYSDLLDQLAQVAKVLPPDKQSYETTLWLKKSQKYLNTSWFEMLEGFCKEPDPVPEGQEPAEEVDVYDDLKFTVGRIKDLGYALTDAEKLLLETADDTLAQLLEKRKTEEAANPKGAKGKKK